MTDKRADSLELCLTQLLEHPETIREMGENARNTVQELALWDEDIIFAFRQVYMQAMSRDDLV